MNRCEDYATYESQQDNRFLSVQIKCLEDGLDQIKHQKQSFEEKAAQVNSVQKSQTNRIEEVCEDIESDTSTALDDYTAEMSKSKEKLDRLIYKIGETERALSPLMQFPIYMRQIERLENQLEELKDEMRRERNHLRQMYFRHDNQLQDIGMRFKTLDTASEIVFKKHDTERKEIELKKKTVYQMFREAEGGTGNNRSLEITARTVRSFTLPFLQSEAQARSS